MILLSRLNGRAIVINAEQIRSVEAHPDTTITMLNGDTILVREPVEEVVERAVDHGRRVRGLAGLAPGPGRGP